ncbi:MAG: transposase [Planctomycetes bacterium]|nr:transposase [Planctomycetota bacterium]
MARPNRIFEDNHYYHLVNRGVDKRRTFDDTEDYTEFINLLEKGCVRYKMNVIAFSLMPNHYHILVQIKPGDNVSACIQWVTGEYAKYYNRKNGRTGHLWQGRFFSKEVPEGRELGSTWRYVEQNAYRANLVAKSEHWKWGSAYIRANNVSKPRVIEPSWWGRVELKRWWSNEPLNQETVVKIRRRVQRKKLDMHKEKQIE